MIFSAKRNGMGTALVVGALLALRLAFAGLALVLLGWVGVLWFSGLAERAVPHGAGQYVLKRIDISIANRQIVLGREQLGQNEGRNSAAKTHIQFGHKNGVWSVANVAATRKLSLRFDDGVSHNAGLAFMRKGDEVLVGEPGDLAVIAVTEVSGRAIILQVGDQKGTRNLQLEANGRLEVMDGGGGKATALAPCRAQPSLTTRLFRSIRRKVSTSAKRVLVRVGGARSCYDARFSLLALAGRGFDALRVVFVRGRGFAVEGGKYPFVNIRRGELVFSVRQSPQKVIWRDGNATAKLTSLVAGRTRYQVELIEPKEGSKSAIRLVPVRGQHRVVSCLEKQHVVGLKRVCERAPDTYARWQKVFANGPSAELAGQIGITGGVVGIVLLLLWRRMVRWHSPRNRASEVLRYSIVVLFAGFTGTAAAFHFIWAGDGAGLGARDPSYAVSAFLLGLASAMFADRMSGLGRIVLVLVAAIVAAGNINLADIGFSSLELRYMRFFNESLDGLAVAGLVLTGFALVPAEMIARVVRFFGQLRGLLVIAGWSLLWMGAWALFGEETGIANLFQPSEILKSTLLLALAGMVANAFLADLQLRHRRAGFIWGIMAAIGATLVVFSVAPVLRSDHSPLVVLTLTVMFNLFLVVVIHFAVIAAEWLGQTFRLKLPPLRIGGARVRRSFWSFLFGWSWPRVKRVFAGLLKGFWARPVELVVPGLLIVVVAGVWWQVPKDRAVIEKQLDEQVGGVLSTPAKRARSWLELDLNRHAVEGVVPVVEFPDIGRQVLLSRRLISGEPCRYADGPAFLIAGLSKWLVSPVGTWASGVSAMAYDWVRPLCTIARPELTRSKADKVRMPAVHNDFASSWLFVTFGRDGAVGILVLQILVVVLMIILAINASRWRRGAEHHRFEVTILIALTSGFAVMLAIHWAISWANAFGVIPVMGQPSTFISAGRSHFLFVGVASVVALLALVRVSRLGDTHKKPYIPMVPGEYSGFEYRLRHLVKKLT